jgi:hypothetical protein
VIEAENRDPGLLGRPHDEKMRNEKMRNEKMRNER